MHAFLIIGKNLEEVDKKASEITLKNRSKLINYELKKIEDVRALANTTRLILKEPTTIYIKNINEASEEALNAFLKNLEEPQPDLVYVLTAENTNSVLPTIASRCQIIRVKEGELENVWDIKKFKSLSEGGKLNFVDKIKDRKEAIGFIKEYIEKNHEALHTEDADYKKVAQNIKTSEIILNRLKANGNVSLQLTNFVVKISNK